MLAATRPTVAQTLATLADQPDDQLTATLHASRALLEKVALADARHQTTARLAALLRTPDLTEAWVVAVDHIHANLTHALAVERANHDGHPTPRSRRLASEAQLVALARSDARRTAQTHRADPDRTVSAHLHALRDAHPDEHHQLRAAALAAAGLPAHEPYDMPPVKGAWAWAVGIDLVDLTPAETATLALHPDDFRELVRADVAGQTDPDLRRPAVLDAWATELTALADRDASRPLTGNAHADAARRRYQAALTNRRGEARRALLARQDRIAAAVNALNQRDKRRRAFDTADRALLAAHPAAA